MAVDDALPPEVCQPLRDIAHVLREHNLAPDAEAVTQRQVMGIARLFAGELVYISKQSSKAQEYAAMREASATYGIAGAAEKFGVSRKVIRGAINRAKK